MDDKLHAAKLLEIEGYNDIADLLDAAFSDSVSPANLLRRRLSPYDLRRAR